jgi:hypothetical protein
VSYHYRYLDERGKPLVECPACGHPLIDPDCVEVEVVMGVSVANTITHRFRTCLDSEGRLIDVDRLVEHGYHSETFCAACDKSLVECEGDGEVP